VVDVSGEVAGRGVHAGPGQPHAEVVALAEAGERAAGGTLVVTLEPCDHTGRTPPCTATILAAGVARVLVGAVDPDYRVAGRGLARLRAAGLEVRSGIAGAAAEAVDPGYFHHRRTGRPRVTLKAALTLDGQAAAADGTSQWITSPEARADGHRLRAEADAVLVGAGTLAADDPLLTVRLPGYDGPQPRPVVVAGRRPLPPGARLWERRPLVLSPVPLDGPGEVVVVPGPDGVDLAAGLAALGERGLLDLLVEGGPTLAGALVRADLVDRGVFYLAARLAVGRGLPGLAGRFATLAAAREIAIVSAEPVGPDLRVEFVVKEH
jgi:diaminohydroxyphosphoribosylaminopyrimidine deaminase/5-amino-6-(5-phosphoribosylamino)uracil reductase